MDAYLFNNRTADPDTAYRFAKGLPVIHPYHRSRVQIDTPLDFLMVADHAELMGVIKSLAEGNEALAKIPIGRRYIEWIQAGRETDVYNEMLSRGDDPNNIPVLKLNTEAVRNTMWGEIIDAAERHNEPGKFTTLLGWEWSATPNTANLHRVVMTTAGADKARQFIPYSSVDSERPEDLWNSQTFLDIA